MTQEPAPDVQRVLDELRENNVPEMSSLSVAGTRKLLENIYAADPSNVDAVESVDDFVISGPEADIPLRVYTPSTGDSAHERLPTLVFFHGGGWVLGSLDSHDPVCRALANAANCIVVSVEYRLAPEHPFPAAVEDCYAAVKWVVEHGRTLAIDPQNVAVGGSSAGGNLAAAVALVARDLDGPPIAHQLLVYPVTNFAFDTESYEEYADGYFLTRDDMQWFWEHYLASELDGRNPYASPLQARTLENLPPATVITAGFDPLRDEGIAYADRLDAAGVDVSHHHYGDVIHGFFGMITEPNLPQARDAIATAGDELRTSLRS